MPRIRRSTQKTPKAYDARIYNGPVCFACKASGFFV